MYEDNIAQCGPTVTSMLMKLDKQLSEEAELTESLLCLKGCIRLMTFASSTDHSKIRFEAPPSLKPSESARDFVVNVG